jgi:predicted DNA-binding protein
MTKKFSVRLSEEAAAQLAGLAKREGLSRAAIVRQALARLPEEDVARGEGVSPSQAVDALDRYGPRRVHSALLVIAVGGATLFGTAEGFTELWSVAQ